MIDQSLADWIPVEQKLPPNCKYVLATIKCIDRDDGGLTFWRKALAIAYQIDGKWVADGYSRVTGIAWMPLPKPYRAGE